MRTTRALTVSPSMLWARGVSAQGGVCSWGGGVCSRGGVCLLWGGGVVSQHALRQTPPCEQNHTRL